MNTCGTCKHFGEVYESLAWNADTDEDVSSGERFHVCGLVKHLNRGYGDTRLALHADPAAVIDGSGYYAAFCVSDEFGCNQWEGK